MLEPVLNGTVALPAGEVREPFVDADDIADVSVAALGDGVQKALGREPRDFAAFCRVTAASGVWNLPN